MAFSYEDFEEIYERTKHTALRYISAHTLNISDIDDIYQEVYVKAYESFSNGEPVDDPEAFVMGIAKHAVTDHYRLTYRLRKRFSAKRDKSDDGSSPEISDDTDIEGLVESKMLCDRIVSEICSMGAETQRIFYMRYVLDLSLAQTADALGISESRVQQLLYKGLRKLRRKYAKEEKR